VDQVEVHKVHLELVQAGAQSSLGLLEAVVVVEALGGYVHILAVESSGMHRLVDPRLVAVSRRGVDVSIAGPQGARHDLGRVLRWNLKHAKAQLRDLVTVVEVD